MQSVWAWAITQPGGGGTLLKKNWYGCSPRSWKGVVVVVNTFESLEMKLTAENGVLVYQIAYSRKGFFLKGIDHKKGVLPKRQLFSPPYFYMCKITQRGHQSVTYIMNFKTYDETVFDVCQHSWRLKVCVFAMYKITWVTDKAWESSIWTVSSNNWCYVWQEKHSLMTSFPSVIQYFMHSFHCRVLMQDFSSKSMKRNHLTSFLGWAFCWIF